MSSLLPNWCQTRNTWPNMATSMLFKAFVTVISFHALCSHALVAAHPSKLPLPNCHTISCKSSCAVGTTEVYNSCNVHDFYDHPQEIVCCQNTLLPTRTTKRLWEHCTTSTCGGSCPLGYVQRGFLSLCSKPGSGWFWKNWSWKYQCCSPFIVPPPIFTPIFKVPIPTPDPAPIDPIGPIVNPISKRTDISERACSPSICGGKCPPFTYASGGSTLCIKPGTGSIWTRIGRQLGCCPFRIPTPVITPIKFPPLPTPDPGPWKWKFPPEVFDPIKVDPGIINKVPGGIGGVKDKRQHDEKREIATIEQRGNPHCPYSACDSPCPPNTSQGLGRICRKGGGAFGVQYQCCPTIKLPPQYLTPIINIPVPTPDPGPVKLPPDVIDPVKIFDPVIIKEVAAKIGEVKEKRDNPHCPYSACDSPCPPLTTQGLGKLCEKAGGAIGVQYQCCPTIKLPPQYLTPIINIPVPTPDPSPVFDASELKAPVVNPVVPALEGDLQGP